MSVLQHGASSAENPSGEGLESDRASSHLNEITPSLPL